MGHPCDPDDDDDGIPDDLDTCPGVANDVQADLDEDGFGDACDLDDDGDGVHDTEDNCPVASNGGQVDFDTDGAGDACEFDDDSDQGVDLNEACADTELNAAIEEVGCSCDNRLARQCPRCGEYRNHGQYASCVVHEASEQVDVGLISVAERSSIVAEAASSAVGRAGSGPKHGGGL